MRIGFTLASSFISVPRTPAPALPPVDIETYVPAAITVVRRSIGWPGIVLHERQGKSGAINYPAGIRQHVFYYFIKPLRSDVVLDGKKKVVQYRPGDGRFTPAGRPVAFRWTGEVHILMLGFQPWFFERAAADVHGTASLPAALNFQRLNAGHPACQLMRVMRNELDCAAGASVVAEGVARSIAVLLLREFQPVTGTKPVESAPPAAVLRVVDLMKQRLAEPLTLDELAEAAGLSPFHFARQFKTATGHPPHDYLIRLRVDRAQELIRQNGRNWNLAAIANESGFADQSHMARHFRRVLGVTPGAFAEAQR
jgi:AraC family transcriptional regulator